MANAGVDGSPTLDPREWPFDSWPILANLVAYSVQGPWLLYTHPVVVQYRNQILGPGQDEDVGFLIVEVARQAFVSLTRDRRQGHVPPEAKGAITGAGIVREAQLRAEPRTSRAGGDRYGQRPGACDWIDGELLTDASNRTTTLWEGGRRQRAGILCLPFVRGGRSCSGVIDQRHAVHR